MRQFAPGCGQFVAGPECAGVPGFIKLATGKPLRVCAAQAYLLLGRNPARALQADHLL